MTSQTQLSPFAVVDVETTGFSNRDRVLEVAVVHAGADGTVTGRWSTLINPQRDIPNTRIHGISGADLIGAPSFADIAGDLAEQLSGRIFVAHNAPFDTRLLGAEFARLGITAAPFAESYLCTQKLTGAVLPASGRSLSTALAAAGISNAHAHAALGDAEATAELLQHYLGTHRSIVEGFLGGLRTVELPVAELRSGAEVVLCPRTGVASGVHDGVWLNQLSSGIPLAGDTNVDEYLDLLSTAMLDRVLSAHEVQQLTDCAADLGISRETAVDLHTGFIRKLAVLAWADGTVTEEEHDDLLAAARALGVPEDEVSRFLESPDAAGTVGAGRGAQARPGLHLAPGDRVTFTGATEIPREVWEARATEAGLDVGGVKKASALLVAADPDSFSRKAAKARDLGIPVVSESGFARLLGELENSGSGEINPRTVLEASRHDRHQDDEPDTAESFDDDDAETGLSGQFYDEDDQAFIEILGEAVDVATGLLSYLARTHGSLRAAVEHAGISAVDGELPSYVEDLLARAGDEDGALSIATTMRRGTVQDVLARAWAACDEREQLILRKRFVALDAATLDELGSEFGVTRERVRQVEKKLMTRLRPIVTSGPVADLLAGIRVHAHPVNTLEAVTGVFPELAVTQPGWEVPLWQILDAFDDDFRVDDSWVCFPDLPTAAQRTGNLVTPMANEEGVARVADILERSSLDDEKVLREWLRTCGFHMAGEHVFTRAGSIPARAAAVLSMVGEPMGAMEIYSAGNETKSERSFRNGLGASDAISRVSIDRWALTRWGLEEYTGIADLIGRRLDAAASLESAESSEAGVPIDDLLEELPRKFGVSAQSVRTYAATGEFELSDGIVRRRTEPMVNTAEPEDSNAVYMRDGRWCHLMTVNKDHLRGSGFIVPNGLTASLGLEWGEPREIPSDWGAQRLTWGKIGNSAVGSIKRILDDQRIGLGQRVWVDLHNGEFFSVTPGLPATLDSGSGMAWLAEHVGAEASADDVENTSAVAVALGLKADAPRRKILARFRHRSDHEAVELLERLWM